MRGVIRFEKAIYEILKECCWIKERELLNQKKELLKQKKGEGLGLQIEYVEVYEGGAKNGKFMPYARTRTRV